jgi:hypothetical protein
MGLASQTGEVFKSDAMVKKSDPLLLDAKSPSVPADTTTTQDEVDSITTVEEIINDKEVRGRGGDFGFCWARDGSPWGSHHRSGR